VKKCLVIGDLVVDRNLFGTATRLCPEAPVPVIVPDGPAKDTRGGAGLVTDQLRELIGQENVIAHFGSKSIKRRTFADGRLICRVDQDSIFVSPRFAYERRIIKTLKTGEIGILVISDYGKGALTPVLAERIMQAAAILEIPVFVDAKNSWHLYPGAFAVFPNQRERLVLSARANPQHIIQKLGADGCKVDGVDVRPVTEHKVQDSTGAGDIFLAAFVFAYRELVFKFGFSVDENTLILCAKTANAYAGRSVEFVGTEISKKFELYTSLGRDSNV
jgi:bifunctional ADP-heptose synthase (sugar kinase/adenylyltransferase)